MKKTLENMMNAVEQYIQRLKEKWASYVSNGMVSYDGSLLETRVLDPQDGRLPFFLVFNEGRRKYVERLAQRKGDVSCPFCSDDFKGLKIDELILDDDGFYYVRGAGHNFVDVFPNQFPCLPYQFILAARYHASEIELLPHQYLFPPYSNDDLKEYGIDISLREINPLVIEKAFEFSQRTGFKVYYNGRGSGSPWDHFTMQASPKHESAPKRDFFESVDSETLFDSKVRVERLKHSVYGIGISGDTSAASWVVWSVFGDDVFKRHLIPINLVFNGDSVYVFPRTRVETPSSFPGWRFGALEIIGNFVCRDRETFQKTDYEALTRALSEISCGSDTKEKLENQVMGRAEYHSR